MTDNNKHLVRVGHEFAAAMSDDTPIITIAKMVTELASALDVQSARSDALAAENAAIKTMNDCLSEELRSYESDGAFEGPKMHLLWWRMETPATDAWVNEQRAIGAEMCFKALVTSDDDSFEDAPNICASVAAQLRGGQV